MSPTVPLPGRGRHWAYTRRGFQVWRATPATHQLAGMYSLSELSQELKKCASQWKSHGQNLMTPCVAPHACHTQKAIKAVD